MKRVTEQLGKTTEEAIRKGLEELKVSRDNVKIEVLEEATSGGILGILSAKLAKVRLTIDKKLNEDEANRTIEKIKEILDKIFSITGETEIVYDITKNNNQVQLKLKGDNVAHLIGYRGKTIESLQSILNSMLKKEDEEYAKVFIEINEYKEQKQEKLKAFANKMANNVIKFRKSIKLEPMSAYERLIIHSELANRRDVETESVGEEPRRCVVIKKRYN